MNTTNIHSLPPNSLTVSLPPEQTQGQPTIPETVAQETLNPPPKDDLPKPTAPALKNAEEVRDFLAKPNQGTAQKILSEAMKTLRDNGYTDLQLKGNLEKDKDKGHPDNKGEYQLTEFSYDDNGSKKTGLKINVKITLTAKKGDQTEVFTIERTIKACTTNRQSAISAAATVKNFVIDAALADAEMGARKKANHQIFAPQGTSKTASIAATHFNVSVAPNYEVKNFQIGDGTKFQTLELLENVDIKRISTKALSYRKTPSPPPVQTSIVPTKKYLQNPLPVNTCKSLSPLKDTHILQDVPGKGNCQFHAIALCLKDIGHRDVDLSHQKLRELGVQIARQQLASEDAMKETMKTAILADYLQRFEDKKKFLEEDLLSLEATNPTQKNESLRQQHKEVEAAMKKINEQGLTNEDIENYLEILSQDGEFGGNTILTSLQLHLKTPIEVYSNKNDAIERFDFNVDDQQSHPIRLFLNGNHYQAIIKKPETTTA